MRVWDFGWQTADRGWGRDRAPGQIRLLVHATDPDRLEARLGSRASKGCVRVPAPVNIFLDRHGVLDADYERVATEDRRVPALFRPDRPPPFFCGHLLG